MPPQLFSREGPAADEVRIIGVELAITPPENGNGRREVELEMFACRHTIPVTNAYWSSKHEVRVTLHTSAGDFTLRGIPPW